MREGEFHQQSAYNKSNGEQRISLVAGNMAGYFFLQHGVDSKNFLFCGRSNLRVDIFNQVYLRQNGCDFKSL